jgi:FkbM family methyltransferase
MKTTKEKRDEFINKGSEIEKELLSIFRKDERLWIADIGACDGLSTIIYSKIFSNASFYVFEPLESNIALVWENFKDYNLLSRTLIFPYALGDKSGTMKFWKSHGQHKDVQDWETGNKSSSLLKPKAHLKHHQWCEFEEYSAEAKRLDESRLMNDIKFVHLDVQGAELSVLNGGKKTFGRTKVFWLEVSTVEMYEGQPLKNDILRYFGDKFTVIKDTCGDKPQGDLLLVRK